MKLSSIITLVVPLAVALSATPQLARAEGGKRACREDVRRLCPNITPGPGSRTSYRQCLQDNAANLSPACQEYLSHKQARRAEILTTCQSDIQSFCSSDIGSGPHTIIRCLSEHRTDLSQACAEQLPHHHHHHGPCATPTPGS